jgi:hypothetical protein
MQVLDTHADVNVFFMIQKDWRSNNFSQELLFFVQEKGNERPKHHALKIGSKRFPCHFFKSKSKRAKKNSSESDKSYSCFDRKNICRKTDAIFKKERDTNT